VLDPGAKMMSAIATVIDADTPEEIEKVVDTIVDPAGTFYRTSLPHALLRKKIFT
jgi:F420-non-reducing hydrogenase small subunit